MQAPYRVVSPFRVRSYEADSYSHLNNGVYVSWCEQGRLDYLLSLGFSYDGFAGRKQWLVVAHTEIDFRSPLHVGEVVRLSTWVEALGRSSCCFGQDLRREPGAPDGEGSDRERSRDEPPGGEANAGEPRAEPQAEPACTAHTVMVFTDEQGPIPMPPDFVAAVRQADLRSDETSPGN